MLWQTAAKVQKTGSDGARSRGVEAGVETAALVHQGENLATVAHDARNMVAALGLYCDLLEQPGVLAAPFVRYGGELRLVAAASRRMVEKLSVLDARAGMEQVEGPRSSDLPCGELASEPSIPAAGAQAGRNPVRDVISFEPVGNLSQELVASRNLLSTLAGPAIALTMNVKGGQRPVRLTATDLIRVLVNLVKNASEAMPYGGRIEISLRERKAEAGGKSLALKIEDTGSGIREGSLEKIFESGFTTHSREGGAGACWPVSHRGLGLAISRSIIEAAGGSIVASNRERGGARFEIELPVTAD
jgi:signal transduction histidine kinase